MSIQGPKLTAVFGLTVFLKVDRVVIDHDLDELPASKQPGDPFPFAEIFRTSIPKRVLIFQ